MKGKRGVVLITTALTVTAAFAAVLVSQALTTPAPRIIANCSTVGFNLSQVPALGTTGAMRFRCNGGTKPAFTVVVGRGTAIHSNVHIRFTPTFTLPAGYTALYVIRISDSCPAPGSVPIASGQKVTLSNVDYDYCATVNASTATLAAFDITWS